MRRSARATRPLETILVAGLLLCCPLVAAEAQPASSHGPGGTYADGWLELATEGTADHFQPRATFRLERAAYVAVFEVEPGVGATLLHPFGSNRQVRLSPGEHAFRLNGVQQAFNRRMMLAHLSQAFVHRDPVVPYNHLVAVASSRPLELDGLLSGRIFEYARGFAGVEEVTGALLAEVLGARAAGEWTIARTSYLKFRSDPLVFAYGDPQTVTPYLALGTELQLLGLEEDPRFPEFVTCLFGTDALAAFFHGLGTVGPDVDCRRRLKAIDVPGVELPATIASAPRSDGPQCDTRQIMEGRVHAALAEQGLGQVMLDRKHGGKEAGLPRLLGELDEARLAELQRVADAGRPLGSDGAETLEQLGADLRRAGAEVPLERMRRAADRDDRRRAAARARAERLRRLGVDLSDRVRLPDGARAELPAAGSGSSTASGGDDGSTAVPDVDPADLPEEAPGRD